MGKLGLSGMGGVVTLKSNTSRYVIVRCDEGSSRSQPVLCRARLARCGWAGKDSAGQDWTAGQDKTGGMVWERDGGDRRCGRRKSAMAGNDGWKDGRGCGRGGERQVEQGRTRMRKG